MKSIAAVALSSVMGTEQLSGAPQQRSPGESRAIFDEGFHWMGAKGARIVCERIRAAGFNVFMPCIWHGRGVNWPSRLAPWDSGTRWIHEEQPGLDPIGELVQTAKRYELEIHPWITVGLRQDNTLLPQLSGTENSSSFDFYNPDFRDLAVELVLEVARTYPVDGINLDVVRFDSRQGERATDARGAVRDVVARIHRGVKAIAPRMLISMDAAPLHPQIGEFGEDSIKWANDGIVDVVYSMQYEAQPDFRGIQDLKKKMPRPEALVVLLGNYEPASDGSVSPRNAEALVSLIEQSRPVSGANGIAVYYYGALDTAQIHMLRRSVFAHPAHPRWATSHRRAVAAGA